MNIDMQELLPAAIASQPLAQLLKAATDPLLKNQAQQNLQLWIENDFQSFYKQLLQLFMHRDITLHILSYSCLLNYLLLKLRRFPANLLKDMKALYLQLYNLRNDQTFNTEMRLQHMAKLMSIYLAKPTHNQPRQQFLTQLAQIQYDKHFFIMKTFFQTILQEMNEVGLLTVLKQKAIVFQRPFSHMLEQLWPTASRQLLTFLITVSKFLLIMPRALFRRMVALIDPSTHQILIWKTIDRLASLLTSQNRFNPSIEDGVQLWVRIRQIFLRQIDPKKLSWQQLSTVLELLKGTISSILRLQRNQQQQIMVYHQLLNISQYDQLICWLARVSELNMHICQDQDGPKMISRKIIAIIEALNDRMNDRQLEMYWQTNNVSESNVQWILCLLSGASKQLQNLFNSQNVFLNIVQEKSLFRLQKSETYYHFLSYYLAFNPYIITQSLAQQTQIFIRKRIQLHQQQFNDSQANKGIVEYQVTQIALLLDIYNRLLHHIQLSKDVSLQYSYVIHSCIHYLTHPSSANLPEPHQHLYNILCLIPARFQDTIASIITSLYTNNFITINPTTVQDILLNNRLQQEMLHLLTANLTKGFVLTNQHLNQLQKIISAMPADDDTLIRQTLALLARIMSIKNNFIINLESQNMFEIVTTNASSDIPLDLIYSYISKNLLINKPLLIKQFIDNSLLQTDMVESQFDAYTRQQQALLDLMFELAPHPFFHSVLTQILADIISFLESSRNYMQQKQQNLKSIVFKKPQLKQIVNLMSKNQTSIICILQFLCLHPAWTKCQNQSALKMISNSSTFANCQARIQGLVSRQIQDLMQEITLEDGGLNKLWSRHWQNHFRDSSVKQLGDKFVQELRLQ